MPRKWRLKSLTRGDIKTAVVSLRQNRGRSAMTMLGIVIAVAAIILVIGSGQGVRQHVQGQADKLGKDLIIVRPHGNDSGLIGSLGTFGTSGSVNVLNQHDLTAVASAHGVATAVPLGVVDGRVVTDDNNSSFKGSVIATNTGFLDVLHHNVAYGGFLGNDEGSDSRAVIGSAVAGQLFGEAVPLGRSFTFRGQQFVVTGVLDQFDSNPLLGDANFNNAIFIKYNVARSLTRGNVGLYEILARASDSSAINQTVRSITAKLQAEHGGAKDFAVLKQNQSLAATNNILSQLTGFTIGAAIVVLIIGGVGVTNIMLVSVAERMHEIGIRKAVGATNRQILGQFMLEAAVLSTIGALLGVVVAIAAILLLRIYSGFQPLIPWLWALLTVIVAIIVGTTFGTIPALKAAMKDPIDALRSE